MVTIRLSRGGSKKRPFYSILVADQRRPLRGRFIERVGFYNPIARGQEEKLRIDTERVEHWLNLGAQPTERFTHLYQQMQNDGEVKSNKRVKNTKSVKRAKDADETKSDDGAEAVKADEAKSDDGAEAVKAEEAKSDDGVEAVKAEETKAMTVPKP